MDETKLCTQTAVEEDESEYEYEYETDSEYEYEDEGDIQESAEVSGSIKINQVQIEAIQIPEPQTIDTLQASTAEVTTVEENKPGLSKEEIEAMKPRLPAYITSPEPCEFSADPCTWIAWMEDQVNKERKRRVRKILSPSPEPPEVEPGKEDAEKETLENREREEMCSQVVEPTESLDIVQENKEVCIEQPIDVPIENINVHTDESYELDNNNNDIVMAEENNLPVPPQVIVEDQEESEWEYESEDEINEIRDTNKDMPIEPLITDNLNVDETITEDTTEIDTDKCAAKLEVDETPASNDLEITDLTENIIEKAPHQEFRKQMSCPAKSGSDLVPEDIQRKLDFIRQKKASTGELARENPTISVNNPNSVLDEETQRKLSFIRQKKLSAAKNLENVQNNPEKTNPGVFLRQTSNPEKSLRPQSMGMGNDASLDDMLSRIKTLREERKQILLDMSAIKSAFATTSDEMNTTVTEECVDSGNNTPNNELSNSFHNDVSGKESPSIPGSLLSRKARRSIDSGIGSKSVCSVQDGSPTAELETGAGKSISSSYLGADGQARRKISREKSCIEGEIFCFICGDRMGKLTKGSIMHMGLEDGDPVCPDALYLTDESKEKIRQIATTKMFTFEAKYELLETLDLETWDIDYEIPAGDVMDKVDAFLVDVENQKQLDKQKFDAMRLGAIDDVFNEEFADLIGNGSPSDKQSLQTCDEMDFVALEEDQIQSDCLVPPPPPPPPMSKHVLASPPPPPPLSSMLPSSPNIPSSSAARSAMLNSIKHGSPHLKPTETVDKSEIPVGQVIHRHLAPIAFMKDIRSVVKDIAKENNSHYCLHFFSLLLYNFHIFVEFSSFLYNFQLLVQFSSFLYNFLHCSCEMLSLVRMTIRKG